MERNFKNKFSYFVKTKMYEILALAMKEAQKYFMTRCHLSIKNASINGCESISLCPNSQNDNRTSVSFLIRFEKFCLSSLFVTMIGLCTHSWMEINNK